MLFEIAAKIFWIHSGSGSNFFQRKFLPEILLNVIDGLSNGNRWLGLGFLQKVMLLTVVQEQKQVRQTGGRMLFFLVLVSGNALE